MYRTILAGLLTASLSLGALSAPAAAQQRIDGRTAATVGVIGGIATILILKKQAERREREERRERKRRAARQDRQEIHRSTRQIHRDPRIRTRDDYRGLRRARIVPEECYRTFRTFDGLRSGYGARCTQNRVSAPRALPHDCLRRIRTDRGVRRIYSPRCLGRAGWTSRTARR